MSEELEEALKLAKPGRILPLDKDGNMSAQGVQKVIQAIVVLAKENASLETRLEAYRKLKEAAILFRDSDFESEEAERNFKTSLAEIERLEGRPDLEAHVKRLEHYDKMTQQLLAASLENKRLREALGWVVGTGPCKPANGKTGCTKTDPFGSAVTCQHQISSEALSSPDHSALAGLYLELREKATSYLIAYDRSEGRLGRAMDELRDILKRIWKEQG